MSGLVLAPTITAGLTLEWPAAPTVQSTARPPLEMSMAPVLIAGGTEGVDIRATAGPAIGGGRVVCALPDGTIGYASADDPTSVATAIGISINAANAGAECMVRAAGTLSDSGWAWTSGQPIYLGLSGVMTQDVPTTGVVIEVGVAMSATRIAVSLAKPIYLQ